MFGKDIGIDLGTANTLVFMKGKGIIMREPSVVAVDTRNYTVKYVGQEAKDVIGRTPGSIVAVRPLKDGVIADFDIAASMLQIFIKKACNNSIFARPRVVICIPSGVTAVERRAVKEASLKAGARYVAIIEEPMAAAIGAGLPVAEATGSMVVDIGGGTSEVAVISLGGIVASRSVRVGGDEFDSAIIQYVKKKYNLLIGDRTAENIKIEIGSAYPYEDEQPMEIKGRNLVDGLPKNMMLYPEEVREALAAGRHPHHPGAHPAGAFGRHHRPRHHPDRRRRAAARSGPAGFQGDRHAGSGGGKSAGLRRGRHRQAAGKHEHHEGAALRRRFQILKSLFRLAAGDHFWLFQKAAPAAFCFF